MADRTADGADRGERNSLDLDALAVSDRFRLFNFTRRDDRVAYLTVATEARTVMAGRVASGSGGNDVLTMRLFPSEIGSAVQTKNGVLHLPGFCLELAPAGCGGGGR